ncbi:hypothetical protein Hanom_Chr17g01582751 [Helianthus anomalus]
MGIRVFSGLHFLEVLAYLLPLCNEDTGPVTPALIFSGCDMQKSRPSTKLKGSQQPFDKSKSL